MVSAQQVNVLPENASGMTPFFAKIYITNTGPPRNAQVPMAAQSTYYKI